jgi:hypothetical protein
MKTNYIIAAVILAMPISTSALADSCDNFLYALRTREASSLESYKVTCEKANPSRFKWIMQEKANDFAGIVADEEAARKAKERAMAQARAEAIERNRREEAEARKPENRLIKAYQVYSNVAFCNELRQGYLVVWVNDVELERAKAATKAIEKSLLAEEPGLNTITLWQTALRQAGGWMANQWSCQQAYTLLREMSPANVYPIQKP